MELVPYNCGKGECTGLEPVRESFNLGMRVEERGKSGEVAVQPGFKREHSRKRGRGGKSRVSRRGVREAQSVEDQFGEGISGEEIWWETVMVMRT